MALQASHRGLGSLAVGSAFMTVAGTTVPIPPTLPMSDVSMNSSIGQRRNRSQGGIPGHLCGSAELSSVPGGRSRPRSRERTAPLERSISSIRPPVPHSPAGTWARRMGPQETADWDAIIDAILDCIETAEENVRRQGQVVGRLDEHNQEFVLGIVNYKAFVRNYFINIANTVDAQLGDLARRITTHETALTTTDQNSAIADGRLN